MVIILGIDDPLFHSGDAKLVGLERDAGSRGKTRCTAPTPSSSQAAVNL